MGLDMYLAKRTFVGNKYRKPEEQAKVKLPKESKIQIKTERINSIVEDVAYWRKANAIHNWFVENVQNGEDDCKEYDVSSEDLKVLLALVDQVLSSSKLVEGKIKNGERFNKFTGELEDIIEDGKYIEDPTVAEKLLPTTEGFFFGGTLYDQYYYDVLVYTKKTIEDLLNEDPAADYKYQSSW